MKINKTMRKRLSLSTALLILMLLTTTTAWAITGSGTSTDPYVISSVSDWNTAAQDSRYYTGGVYVALDKQIRGRHIDAELRRRSHHG